MDKYKDLCAGSDFSSEYDVRKCGEAATIIWKDFLSTNSNTEVNLPSADRKETIQRLSKMEQYREKVFDVALQDPIETLHKDIRHRFIQSKQFFEYCNCEQQYEHQKPSTIKPPVHTILDFDFPDNRTESDFTLVELVCDKFLFVAMKRFLENRKLRVIERPKEN